MTIVVQPPTSVDASTCSAGKCRNRWAMECVTCGAKLCEQHDRNHECPPPAEIERPQLRSPEKMLHHIASMARLGGIPAPRRISFDEPSKGQPLAVLSLSWPSLADMRPWLVALGSMLDGYKPNATTVYGEYHGWSLMMSCPDHFGREANHDEAVRLSVVHLGNSGEPFKCGGDSGAFSAYLTEVTCPDCAGPDRYAHFGDVLTVDPDLSDGNDAAISHLLEAAAAIPVLVLDVSAVLPQRIPGALLGDVPTDTCRADGCGGPVDVPGSGLCYLCRMEAEVAAEVVTP